MTCYRGQGHFNVVTSVPGLSLSYPPFPPPYFLPFLLLSLSTLFPFFSLPIPPAHIQLTYTILKMWAFSTYLKEDAVSSAPHLIQTS